MAGIYEDFQEELSDLARRHAGRPRREMTELFLLSLEREQLVAVGYRESIIRSRLERMPLPDNVKELIRHALLWAWKDEEMHAIYIRGALLRLGSFPIRVNAFLRQGAGALGGWSASVRQHARFADAPFSRTVATLVTWAGLVSGKVPKQVRQHLDLRSFRDFCAFNVEAEKTAWLCWSRLTSLASGLSDVPPQMAADFRRIEVDEKNHELAFAAIAGSLDDQDRLAPGEDAGTLAAKLREAGEFFLPRGLRTAAIAGNPLGSGGRVFVQEGETLEEKVPLFRRLLLESGLPEALRERAAALGKSVAELRVAVKPTFMLGYHRKDPSPITDPALVVELARALRELGCGDVAVIEGPNIYDQFYGNRSVREVARYFAIESPDFRLVDASEEQVAHGYRRGMAQYTVAKTWKEADFRISFPKLRSHPIEMALLTVGNIEWLGARCDEFLFSERQAQRETAVMSLVGDFPPHFALIDGYENAPDGLLGAMGCRRPRTPKRFYAGADALAVDTVALRHLGILDPHDSSLLRAATHWFGDPLARVEVVGVDEPIRDWRGPYHSELSSLLSFLAHPVYVFGSFRGTLFVPEMDEQAFPPLEKEGLFLRWARAGLRAFLGLRIGNRTP